MIIGSLEFEYCFLQGGNIVQSMQPSYVWWNQSQSAVDIDLVNKASGSSIEGGGNVTTLGGNLATVVISATLPADDSQSVLGERFLSSLSACASMFLSAAALDLGV